MVPTLDPHMPLDALYSAVLFTLLRLHLDPRLEPFAPAFEQAVAAWWEVFKKERALLDKKLAAEANLDHIGAQLDATSDGVAGTLLIETKNNRRSETFTRYFGTKQPNRFRKMPFLRQLAAMRAWPPSLKDAASPTLKAYGELLAAQVEAADDAITKLSLAEQELTDFCTFGERKQLFNDINGLRKALHGDVSKLIHAHPEWNLGRAYVHALFQHEAPTPEPTDAEIDRKVEALHAEAEKLLALRAQREKDADAEVAARAEAEKKAKLAAIEAAEKDAAAALAKVAAMKAELGPVA